MFLIAVIVILFVMITVSVNEILFKLTWSGEAFRGVCIVFISACAPFSRGFLFVVIFLNGLCNILGTLKKNNFEPNY